MTSQLSFSMTQLACNEILQHLTSESKLSLMNSGFSREVSLQPYTFLLLLKIEIT